MSIDEHLSEFRKIPHCGHEVKFKIKVKDGAKAYSTRLSHSAPTAAAWYSIYALPNGLVLCAFDMGGLGGRFDPPMPTSDSIAVFIGSDATGTFGHRCPSCAQYFRSHGTSSKLLATCPYCGIQTGKHMFMTEAQQAYTERFVTFLQESVDQATADTEVVLPYNTIVDQVNAEVDKIDLSEIKQQSHWKCSKCRTYNDILGEYGYCHVCGYRNNLQSLMSRLSQIGAQIEQAGIRHSDLLKLAASAFDGFARDLVDRLVARTPMTPRRKERADRLRFHELARTELELREVFDIELFAGMKLDDVAFAKLRFLRRNLYEHRAGVVDQEYLDASGDAQPLGKRLSETPGNIRNLIEVTIRLATNLDNGFHSILPPSVEALRVFGVKP